MSSELKGGEVLYIENVNIVNRLPVNLSSYREQQRYHLGSSSVSFGTGNWLHSCMELLVHSEHICVP